MKIMTKETTIPMPSNINMWWNPGSMLGSCLMIQIISGIMLSMNYCPNTSMAFQSIVNLTNNSSMGWMMHNTHINGASMFFLMMFTHMMRGIYYMSFTLKYTWTVGTIIMISSMATAFLGYVLPWGQMSFWGATVITNLISAIPYIGKEVVEWIWGGFAITNATLNRFYTLHFLLPMTIIMLVMIHLMTLHQTGSTNPMGTQSKISMIPFNPYFTLKDYVGILLILMIMLTLNTQMPLLTTDPDNFTIANPLITPPHIKPEWYFLFAYSILRSIPNKLGGVACLMLSILVYLSMPLSLSPNTPKSPSLFPSYILSTMFWSFMMVFILLSWTGGKPIESPYTMMAQFLSMMYFTFFIVYPLTIKSLEISTKH